MLQPCIAFLEEGFGLKRHASAALLGLLAAMGCGFVLYFSKGSVALDTFDFWVGTFFMFMLGMFQTFVYGWIFGIERGERELHQGASIRVPRFVQYLLKYVTPTYLVVIFIAFCWFNLPSATTPKFELDAAAVAALTEGEPSDAMITEFKNQESSLPKGAVLVKDADGKGWSVNNAVGLPIYLLSPSGDAGAVQVSSYQVGSIEKIWRQPVAIASVGFILLILVFLLLLAQIAGKRWQKAGRFDGLDAEPAV
jgi:hypothetical protein